MLNKMKTKVKDCISEITGFIFILFAAPVIHFARLNKVDDVPTKEEIEKSRALADKYKERK